MKRYKYCLVVDEYKGVVIYKRISNNDNRYETEFHLRKILYGSFECNEFVDERILIKWSESEHSENDIRIKWSNSLKELIQLASLEAL